MNDVNRDREGADQDVVLRPGIVLRARNQVSAMLRSGSLYDRYVLGMRIFLTLVAAGIAVLLGIWPALNEREVSFTLSYEDVAESDDQIRMINPRFVGKDRLDRVFTVSASSGLQDTPDDPRVRLENISASLDLGDGVRIVATSKSGTYFVDQNLLELGGDVVLETTDGYRFTASKARFDLEKNIASSRDALGGYGPLGRFLSAHFEIRVDEKIAIFEGGIRMRLDPKGGGGKDMGPIS